MNKKINKILIANRGEIAVRIIRTCKKLGIKTVAVYSEIDVNSLHVKLADESQLLGPAPVRDSYLNQQKIIEIALETKSNAIHPGYGFLSENASFVELVRKSGIIFIGPDPKSIRLMGDKTAARSLAQSIGVSIVPGTVTPINSFEEAVDVAQKISYPLLIKAAGGGGGKGMRIINSESDLSSGLKSSQSEARSSFSDDRVYIEKYIENPRHIEVQILADTFGNVIHLGERECSIQRRHQKIIEESPSTYINSKTRDNLTKAAIALIKASGYTNAGTLEFIFDQNHNFYFLEMNTRLQVEHPVTEMRTGIDLVNEQINIAEGLPLVYKQNDVSFKGHSIECRIYAEDPTDNFFPSVGKIVLLQSSFDQGIREDSGVTEGDEITSYYDPILSKLIAWGHTRTEAINKMISALSGYRIFGIKNNLSLCKWILQHDDFKSGNFNTNFLNQNFNPNVLQDIPNNLILIGGVTAILGERAASKNNIFLKSGSNRSKWKQKILESYR